MSWGEVFTALRKVMLIEDQVAGLNERVRALTERCEDINQRLAKLEGKFELLESIGGMGRKRRPPNL
jgi:hypothetical protein